MSAKTTARTKHLTIAAAVLIAIAALAGAWVLPPAAAAENTPAVTIAPPTADAGRALSVSIVRAPGLGGDQSMTAKANIPKDSIKDGQWCQGYAVVHDGTPPYKFEWSGQFTNDDAHWGPLGEDQIVNGYIDGNRADWLQVEVWDKDEQYAVGFTDLLIGDVEENKWCDA